MRKLSELTDRQRAWLEKTKQEWSNGAHHDGLLKWAGVYRKLDIGMDEAISDMQGFYMQVETPDKHDEHMKEVEDACQKKYDESDSDGLGGIESRVTKARVRKATNDDYIEERKAWLASNDCDCNLYDEVLKQDLRDDRVPCRVALDSLFRNVSGRLWHGVSESSMTKRNWLDVSKLCTVADSSKYVSVCTFGGLLYQRKQADGTFDEEDGSYARTDDNVDKVACLVMEFDSPMDLKDGFKSDEVRALPDDERKAYRDRILKHTCLVLEKAGIKPTTITFSGGKSYHVLIRLKTPVDREGWLKCKGRLKTAYSRLGADTQMLTFSRCTRMPSGSTLLNAQKGDCQRLMYFDDGAEMELDELASRLDRLADDVCEVKGKGLTMPMTWKTGEESSKLVYDHENWTKFIKEIGLRKVYVDEWDEQRLIQTDENGISRWMSPSWALDYQIDMIRTQDNNIAVNFSQKRASSLLKDNMADYHFGCETYNPPKDSLENVLVPFRNGMLVITKKGCELMEGDYMGYDILMDMPTVRRDWKEDYCESEFQTFLEHACGSLEDAPHWKDRFKAVCSMLGYLVCRAKENVNYFCVLIEESMTENNGGTGKSLIMKSVGEWRTRRIKDMKNYDSNTKRFFWGGIAKERPDYVVFDDLPKGFKVEDFYTMITGDMSYEQKGKDERVMKYKDLPKFVGATNYFLLGIGNSMQRRVRFFEISNHYNGSMTPFDEFGHNLFEDWSDAEWHRFDTFIMRCCATYLEHGLVQYFGDNSVVKMLDANLEDLADVLDDFTKELPRWFTVTEVVDLVHNESTKFRKANKSTIIGKVKAYCELKGLVYDDHGGNVKKHNGETKRWIVIDEKGDDNETGNVGQQRGNESGDAVTAFLTGGNETEGEKSGRYFLSTSALSDKCRDTSDLETCNEVTDTHFFSSKEEKNIYSKGECDPCNFLEENSEGNSVTCYPSENDQFLPLPQGYDVNGYVVATVETGEENGETVLTVHFPNGRPAPQRNLTTGKPMYRMEGCEPIELDEHGDPLDSRRWRFVFHKEGE